jgi:hypothetical protein
LYLDFVESRLDEAQRTRLLLPCHALHAARLEFRWRDAETDISAPPEKAFEDFFQNAATS